MVAALLRYVIESKGEHLSGNPDTQYKKSVLALMTEQHREKKICTYHQMKLPFEIINEEAEFYLVEERKEGETLKNLMR
ncbi:MAG: hypothetical protein AYP45_18435 [Candidatus Brocadia carolinensis]|uniref:Uncharacterized protein n=1 Tax=Candidatus Brocadia carolinensis TaxID=1004156 RepID=A0A1V4AP14_9BACT|nr:hypothetical protein [Candidatus Brocadia sp.]OOP54841.1 MAG: hypothetical protein AYP45_18435 [Candidatus Brocadia caroliniensis]